MPKFLKNQAIALLDGGIEAYLLALYGMSIPQVRPLRKAETKYAPIIGLFGASAELLAKACLVQGKGPTAMYKDGDMKAGAYRFGKEVIEELRRCIRDEDASISFIWEDIGEHESQRKQLLHCLGKFKLLQELRAGGLHAGAGCSRDIVVSVATTVSNFIVLISKARKLWPYLKNVPKPESTIRDREAIIEDLTRRLRSSKNGGGKAEQLRGIYLVLPYIPEVAPDWVEAFDRMAVAPPTEGDLSYLTKTLEDAHSIYLIKSRGGKEGIPVHMDPQNPGSIPIAIQNIKRELSSTPDKFHNDVLSANTRLAERRLDLPIDEFLVDLYAVGLEGAGVISADNEKITAQQAWPFVASAYSVNGTPRPCWFIIRQCDDIDKLIYYMKQAEKCGNGYLRNRMPYLLSALEAYKNNTIAAFGKQQNSPFKDVMTYRDKIRTITKEQQTPFSSTFLKKYPPDQNVSDIIHGYIAGTKNAGDSLSSLMDLDVLDENGRKAARTLMHLCYDNANKNGLISVLRGKHLKSYISEARKMMFMADLFEYGPSVT